MTHTSHGRELSIDEAIAVFSSMPEAWQIASLHPDFARVDANRDNSLYPVHWCYEEDGRRLLHSFHLGANPQIGVWDIQSPYGYGGPLANSDDPKFVAAGCAAFERWARARSVVAEFFRFHPLVPHERWYAGDVAYKRETVCVDLERNLFSQYEVRRRTDVRRALEAGLTLRRVSAEVMYSEFPRIYFENMRRVGATAEYLFPDAYFEALAQFVGCESWLAYAGEEVVAGALLLVSRPAGVVEYHLAAQLRAPDPTRPLIGLLHEIAVCHAAMTDRHLYLGGGRSSDAADRLLFFKKGFSRNTLPLHVGSRIYEADRYAQLEALMPDKAATGRVLFFRT